MGEGRSSDTRIVGVDNTSRKTWDREEYANRALEREKKDKESEESAIEAKKRRRLERDPLHQGLIVERATLKRRDFALDLDSRVGKTQVITNATPNSQQAGYYCSVCDCLLRDSHSYLDHINGKYHNRALGMSMRVERSTPNDIRRKFEELKEKRSNGGDVVIDHVADGFDRKELEMEEKAMRRRERRRRKSVSSSSSESEEDNDMALAMGFSGFGSSKR